MRAIWKGAITFGLVNVPVSLYSATESHDVKLHQVHDADGGRIRYQRKCEVCGEVVPYEHIDKAYDDGDTTVVLTGDDLDSLPAERSREIDVIEFVPSDQIDPLMFEGAYYLSPNSASTKSYVLLRRTLEETDRTAIVSFALRQKTRLGALRVKDDVLVLQTMLWPDEVRAAEFDSLDEEVKISDKELKMSASLVASFEADFDPQAHHDDYQEQLRTLIEAKIEQGESLDTEATFGAREEESGEVLDLMEALRRSVAETRAKRGRADGAQDDDAQDDDAQDDDEKSDAGEKKPARSRSGGSRSGGSSGGSSSGAKKSSGTSSGSSKSGTSTRTRKTKKSA